MDNTPPTPEVPIMTYSAATELVKWTRSREEDIAAARRIAAILKTPLSPRNRAVYLNTLHIAVKCVRTCNRMIAFEAAELSMCPCGLPTARCICVAPF
jgi:hypothetical protein